MSLRDLLRCLPRRPGTSDDIIMGDGGPLLNAIGAFMAGPIGRIHGDHGVLAPESATPPPAFPDAMISDLAERLAVSPQTAKAVALFALTHFIPGLVGARPAAGASTIPAAALDQNLDKLLQRLGATPDAQHDAIVRSGDAAQLAQETGLDESRAATALYTALGLFRDCANAQTRAE